MTALFLAIIHPAVVARSLKSQPRWIVETIILATVLVGVGRLMMPVYMQVMLDHLPASTTVFDKTNVVQSLLDEQFSRLAFLPIRAVGGWLVFSLMLFSFCRLLVVREPVRFIQIFSMEVHAETVMVIDKIVSLILMIAGADEVKTAGVSSPLSIAGLLALPMPFPTRVLLDALNPFTLGYLIILTAGIAELCSLSRMKAAVIVGSVWSVSLLFNVSLVAIIVDRLQLSF